MKRNAFLPKSKNIKKIRLSGLMCVLVLLSGPVSLAMDPLGPPITNLQPGQFQLGLEYSRSNMDVKLIDGTFINYVDGSLDDSGKSIDLTLKELEQTKSYVNFGYGIDYNWEVFLRLSGTKAELGDSLLKEGEKFESDSMPAFGGGIKATFYDGEYLKIG